MSASNHAPYGSGSTPSAPLPKSAMAIAGLVVGAVALAASWIPIFNNVAFFIALLGVLFAIIGLVGTVRGKKSGKGIAIAALVISIVACAVVLGTQSAYSDALDEAMSEPTVADASSDEAPANDGSAEAAASDEADYTIADEKLTSDYGYAKITGTLTNNTDSDLDYVQLEYVLYDEDGVQIDTAYANTSNLKAGGTWKFEATSVADADEVDSYERAEVTGW